MESLSNKKSTSRTLTATTKLKIRGINEGFWCWISCVERKILLNSNLQVLAKIIIGCWDKFSTIVYEAKILISSILFIYIDRNDLLREIIFW